MKGILAILMAGMMVLAIAVPMAICLSSTPLMEPATTSQSTP